MNELSRPRRPRLIAAAALIAVAAPGCALSDGSPLPPLSGGETAAPLERAEPEAAPVADPAAPPATAPRSPGRSYSVRQTPVPGPEGGAGGDLGDDQLFGGGYRSQGTIIEVTPEIIAPIRPGRPRAEDDRRPGPPRSTLRGYESGRITGAPSGHPVHRGGQRVDQPGRPPR